MIFGGTTQDREQKIEEILSQNKLPYQPTNPDLLIVKLEEDEKTIGIDQIKKALKFLSSKPLTYKAKALIINNADQITQIAQTTLLKTLEEPPPGAVVILEAQLKDSLLETILSRCRKVEVKSPTSAVSAENRLEVVLAMKVGERLDYAIELSKLEKQEILEKLKEWIQDARTMGNYLVAEKLLKAANEFERVNLNQKLFVENLLINII